jgi:hypothetical protein
MAITECYLSGGVLAGRSNRSVVGVAAGTHFRNFNSIAIWVEAVHHSPVPGAEPPHAFSAAEFLDIPVSRVGKLPEGATYTSRLAGILSIQREQLLKRVEAPGDAQDV